MPHQPRGLLAEVVGVYDCWSCRTEIPVRLSGKGNLSAPCHFCGFPHYAIAGTVHFDNLKAAVRPIARPGRARIEKAAA